MTSKLGAFLDPVADKLMVSTALATGAKFLFISAKPLHVFHSAV
jgi:phosphatidylglycerophosphate synthase